MNSISGNFPIINTNKISSPQQINTQAASAQETEHSVSDSFIPSATESERIEAIPSFAHNEESLNPASLSADSACQVSSSLSGNAGSLISSLKEKLFLGIESLKEFISDKFGSSTNVSTGAIIIEHVGDLTNIPDIIPDEETLALADAYGAINGNSENGIQGLHKQLDSMKKSKLLQRKPVAESSMTLAQKTALYSYTGNAYTSINKALWHHDEDKIQSLKPIIDKASEALETLPSYKGKVFRGTSLYGADLTKYIPGAKMQYAGFTSTSTAALGKFKGNTEIMIDCLKSGSAGKDISAFSAFPNEKEILFPPDSNFIVISHKEKDGRHFIHLKELPKEK